MKAKKEELKKETASVVVEEGVWMAAVNDSDDENMADNKFDNLTISEDDMFFSEEEDKEGIKKKNKIEINLYWSKIKQTNFKESENQWKSYSLTQILHLT